MKCHYKEIRKSVKQPFGKVSKTDQSYKKMCDINVIVKNAMKSGVLPHVRQKVAHYIDNSKIPSLMEAQALISEAHDTFMALPSEVRKLMDNDATKLVDFINNPKNKDILLKHGILEEVKKPMASNPPSDSAVEEPKQDASGE